MKYHKLKFLQNPRFWLLLLFIIASLEFLLTVILNHYMFKTNAHDYANYNFALWDYAHFQANYVPTLLPTKIYFLQDHFSFAMFFMIPLYWLFNWITGTYTLLIFQTLLIIFSGYYVYLLIKTKSNSEWMGLGAVFLYFIIHGRFTAFTSDCNLEIITVCFIPIFLYFFEKKNYWIASIFFFIMILFRENFSLWFIFISTVLIINHRRDKKAILFASSYIVVSIVFFILMFSVFIPMLETQEYRYNLFNYKALGSGPAEALQFILTNPIEAIKLLFINHSDNTAYDWVKFEFYYVYLISGGFILFYRPIYFIWFIPIIAQKMYNDASFRWGIELYYSIEIVTLLPISVFLILSEIKNKKIKTNLSLAICFLTVLIMLIKLNYRNREMGWWKTRKEGIFTSDFFNKELNIKNIHQMINQIPDGASVCASNRFLPHLSQRKEAFFFPLIKDAEYLLLNKKHDCYLVSEEQYLQYLDSCLHHSKYRIINEDEFVVLLKRNE